MSATHIALLRGINVGKARRIAMADLRALVADLGYVDVRTLLNSGNIVFTAPGVAPAHAAARIEEAIATRFGFTSRVTALTAAELAEAVDANPLLEIAGNPSRLLVAILNDPADRQRLESLLETDWSPDALALGTRAAYLWCPDGMIESRLGAAMGRLLGDAVTTRNWTTITKLHALCQGQHG